MLIWLGAISFLMPKWTDNQCQTANQCHYPIQGGAKVGIHLMNILSKSFPRAQFWSDFQIYGTKMFGRPFSIHKNI